MSKNPVSALFEVEDQYVEAALRDLFALGCYLHATGNTEVGAKTCATALRAARASNVGETVRKLEGRQAEWAQACAPHIEVTKFLERHMPKKAKA